MWYYTVSLMQCRRLMYGRMWLANPVQRLLVAELATFISPWLSLGLVALYPSHAYDMATLDSRPGCRVELSTGDIVGLSFTAQAGCISAVAVMGLLGIVAIKYAKRVRNPNNSSWRLIRTNIDGLMLNLLIADLFMSLGAILDIKWAHTAQVSCGGHCNAQGAIQLIGETAVALFTLAITLLTFITVVRGRAAGYNVMVWGGVSVVVWVFVVLWAVVGGVVNEEFYVPTPHWCWISQKYKVQRLLGEYLWLWLSGFGSILLYTPLFFMLRGNVVWEPEMGWRSVQWRWRRLGSEHEFGDKDIASVRSVQGGMSPFTLLWYPLAYTIVVLPVSVVRWMTFTDQLKPSPNLSTASFVAVSIFNLSGVVNVTLILFTRTNVLGLGGSPTTSLESLGGPDEQFSHPEDVVPDTDQTGFGGPRVILRDDDSEFESGRVNRSAAGGSALGLTGLDAPRSPGRAYLESLGIERRPI